MNAERDTVGFNFLREPELPAPAITETEAGDILAAHFDLNGNVKSLGSQQDKNFLVDVGSDIAGVLKIANPAFNEIELTAQELAAERIAYGRAGSAGGAVVAQPARREAHRRSRSGLERGRAHRLCPAAAAPARRNTHRIRVSRPRPRSPSWARLAGRVSRALAGFSHAGLDRVLQWDLRYGAEVVRRLVTHVDDDDARARL